VNSSPSSVRNNRTPHAPASPLASFRMGNIRALALVAVLAVDSRVAVDAAACFPAWRNGAYQLGDTVSHTATTTTIEVTDVVCVGTGGGCVNGVGKKTTTTKTLESYNYECKAAVWCSQVGFEPDGIFEGSAWTREAGACTGAAGTAVGATPDNWARGGCPPAFAAGSDYEEFDVVSVKRSTYTEVFECKASPNSLFCGMAGYEPGTSIYWEQAWTSMNACTGSLSPTSAPAYVTMDDAGGCPGAFDGGVVYDEGDKVSKDGLVFQCKSYPFSRHCSQPGYEPQTEAGTDYWMTAWTVTGYCTGTISPTSSPSFDQLVSVGGCPDVWGAKAYEEGDRVASADGLVYECKPYPQMAHCGQAGYQPGGTTGHPDAWKAAWTLKGFCDGSIGPTSSPSFDELKSVGACSEDWSSGGNVKYEEGDMVSVNVSTTPLRKVSFRCKAWPFSGHCGQYSPTQFGGDQGWAFVGGCDGSIGPTASPSFDQLADGGACPDDWSSSKTDYMPGDLVSYTVSTLPSRKLLYECRTWPNSQYCNQGSGFQPGTTYGNMAWTAKGSCEGSFAPTASPVDYAGTCEYQECRMTTSTESCVCGSANCSGCNGSTGNGTKEVKTDVCTTEKVDHWTNSMNYFTNDVIRVSTARFKCKEWPSYFWCRLEAYKPDTNPSGFWTHAWTPDGVCA